MAEHTYLMDALEAAERGTVFTAIHPTKIPHPTFNYLVMGTVGYYIWAYRYGTAEQRTEAHRLVLDLFGRQLVDGHWCLGPHVEQMLADPHFNFVLYAVVECYQFALAAGHADVAAAALLNNRHTFGLLEATQCPDGSVVYAGTRFEAPPANCYGVATICNREVRGIAQRGNAARRDWNGWSGAFRDFDAARVVRKYGASGVLGPLGVSSLPVPKLRLSMTVERYHGGHRVTLDGNPNSFALANICASQVVVLYGGGSIEATFNFAGNVDIGPAAGQMIASRRYS